MPTPSAATKRLSAPRPLQLSNSNSESQSQTLAPSTPDSPASTPSSLTRKHSRRQGSIAYLAHDSCPRYDIRSQIQLSHVQRTHSVDSKVGSPSIVKAHRKSTGSIAEPERSPLTFADKHGDLLRFIAQKESKCMELRSQLAIHEAELMQLKRKWEKIVNKGFDRAVSVSGSSASLLHTPGVPGGQVLGGIKEGVERLLAAGLGELVTAPTIQPVGTNTTKTHSTQQSTSSVATSSSASTRFSQSSMNSSVMEDDFPLESPEEEEHEVQVLIVGDAEPTPTVSPNPAVKITDMTEVSSMEQKKSAKMCRRRSRDATSTIEGKFTAGPDNNRTAKITTSSLSSIPNLGSLPPGSPSWVIGTVGKKWEELQRTETFAKSQKRASLLISDVSQSFMNAWSPPMTSPRASMSRNPSITSQPSPSSVSPGSLSTSSLLDDDGDSQGGMGIVMTPDFKLASPVSKEPTILDASKTQIQEDDDEWNW